MHDEATKTLDFEANKNCQKHSPENRPPHWLHRVVNATLISSAAAVGIDQIPSPAKTNDMGIFPRLWKRLVGICIRSRSCACWCARQTGPPSACWKTATT